jgi:acyl carrier protein
VDETQRWLISWLQRRGHSIVWERDAGLDFVKAGWVDSFTLVELIEDMERALDFRFTEAEMNDPAMATLKGLAALSMKRRAP